jgi:hypothetical protein
MVAVMVNMLSYLNTMKLESIVNIRNIFLNYHSKFKLSLMKIHTEDLSENIRNVNEITQKIAQKDRWFNRDYKSMIFDNPRTEIIGGTFPGFPQRPREQEDFSDVYYYKIKYLNISYQEMRYFSHRLNSNVVMIFLDTCNIGDREMNCLIGVNLENLNTLSLRNNPVTNKTIEILNKCNIPMLENFDISGTKITFHGINMMPNLPVYDDLKALSLVFDNDWEHVFRASDFLGFNNLRKVMCRKRHVRLVGASVNWRDNDLFYIIDENEVDEMLDKISLKMYNIRICLT